MSIFNRFRRYPELRTAIVNLRSGTSFRGVVWRHAGPYIVIRQVEMLQDRGENVTRQTVDGEVVVKLADIDFIQVL